MWPGAPRSCLSRFALFLSLTTKREEMETGGLQAGGMVRVGQHPPGGPCRGRDTQSCELRGSAGTTAPLARPEAQSPQRRGRRVVLHSESPVLGLLPAQPPPEGSTDSARGSCRAGCPHWPATSHSGPQISVPERALRMTPEVAAHRWPLYLLPFSQPGVSAFPELSEGRGAGRRLNWGGGEAS